MGEGGVYELLMVADVGGGGSKFGEKVLTQFMDDPIIHILCFQTGGRQTGQAILWRS